MKFVMSAIVLLAFVFILTSCHFDGAALSGNGQAHEPVYSDPYGSPPVQTQAYLPPCTLELVSEGTVYFDESQFSQMLTFTAVNDYAFTLHIEERDGLLPTLSTLRYQTVSESSPRPALRTVNCADTGTAPHSHDYLCTLAAANDGNDQRTFFMESMEFKLPAYVDTFVFRAKPKETAGTCAVRGNRVTFVQSSDLPTLLTTH